MAKPRVIIIDGNDIDMRMRLSYSINSTNEFGECVHSASPSQALDIIKNTELRVDLVFISYCICSTAIKEFAESAKENELTQDTSLVMILPAGSNREHNLAEYMLIGIDGFLLEPFSTDDLVKVSKLAGRISKDKLSHREFVTLKMLARDQIRLLDVAYCLMRGNISPAQTLEKLRKLKTELAQLSESSLELYHSLLIDYSERSMVPIAIPKNIYDGKSDRARKRVDQMLISNLESPKVKLDPKKEVRVDGRIMKLPSLSGR